VTKEILVETISSTLGRGKKGKRSIRGPRRTKAKTTDQKDTGLASPIGKKGRRSTYKRNTAAENQRSDLPDQKVV